MTRSVSLVVALALLGYVSAVTWNQPCDNKVGYSGFDLEAVSGR